jgi:hypothetical protein
MLGIREANVPSAQRRWCWLKAVKQRRWGPWSQKHPLKVSMCVCIYISVCVHAIHERHLCAHIPSVRTILTSSEPVPVIIFDGHVLPPHVAPAKRHCAVSRRVCDVFLKFNVPVAFEFPCKDKELWVHVQAKVLHACTPYCVKLTEGRPYAWTYVQTDSWSFRCWNACSGLIKTLIREKRRE